MKLEMVWTGNIGTFICSRNRYGWKYMNKIPKTLLALVLGFWLQNAHADFCPTPPTRVEPQVKVSVEVDKKTKNYIYRYTVTNGKSALLPINSFIVRITKDPISFKTPKDWEGFSDKDGDVMSHFTWSTAGLSAEVSPGSSKSDFVVESHDAPGLVQYYVLGKTSARIGTPTADDDEPTPDCEGFYDDKPYLERQVSGITQGPVSDGRISLDIELKDSKGEHECGPISPYVDKGVLNVLVKGKKDFSVDDLDLTTLRFGVGQAPVVSSRKLGKSDNILLQFDIQKTEIECGRDRVLFLTGKTKTGKDVLGGAEVKTKECDKRPKKKLPEHHKRPKAHRGH